MDIVPCFFSFCLKNEVYKFLVNMSDTLDELIIDPGDKGDSPSGYTWYNISSSHSDTYEEGFDML